MTAAHKVNAIVQAGHTLLQGGKYKGEGSPVELDLRDFERKELSGVVKRAVFIGTDLADLQAAIASSDAPPAITVAEQVANGLSTAFGSMQLAENLERVLSQTALPGDHQAGAEGEAPAPAAEQKADQVTEVAAKAAADDKVPETPPAATPAAKKAATKSTKPKA